MATDKASRVRQVKESLISKRSMPVYARWWAIYHAWKITEDIPPGDNSENTVLLFLDAQAKKYQPSTLWNMYSCINKNCKVARLALSRLFRRSSTSASTSTSTRRSLVFCRSVSSCTDPSARRYSSEEDVLRFVKESPQDLRNIQRKLILLFGYFGMMRSVELYDLQWADISELPDALRVVIQRSKTDRAGLGFSFHVPRGATDPCPLQLWATYVGAIGGRARTGPVWRVYCDRLSRFKNQRLGQHQMGHIAAFVATTLGKAEPAGVHGPLLPPQRRHRAGQQGRHQHQPAPPRALEERERGAALSGREPGLQGPDGADVGAAHRRRRPPDAAAAAPADAAQGDLRHQHGAGVPELPVYSAL